MLSWAKLLVKSSISLYDSMSILIFLITFKINSKF